MAKRDMEVQAGTRLGEVEALLSATSKAPTFGMNSRELILRAAREACLEQEEDLPLQSDRSYAIYQVAPSATHPPAQAAGAQAISGALADRLIQEGLKVHERPMVQYVPRTSIPRIARQALANRLAGQHLAHLLQQAGNVVSVEAVRCSEAASARKHAVTAALAQELNVFKSASGKQVYMNMAARTSASPTFLPSEALPQVACEETSEEAVVQVLVDTKSKSASGKAEEVPPGPPDEQKSMRASPDAPKAKRARIEDEMSKEEGPALVLKTADIDWEAASGADSDEDDEEGNSAVSPHEQRSEVEVSLGEEELRQATRHFVKAILNPLYHSQVLDKDLYKKVLQKVVDKVLRTHSGAADASFLIEEASRIQQLVQDYIHHMRE